MRDIAELFKLPVTDILFYFFDCHEVVIDSVIMSYNGQSSLIRFPESLILAPNVLFRLRSFRFFRFHWESAMFNKP